jgi:peptidoglycan hydrolase CwlO-like protein
MLSVSSIIKPLQVILTQLDNLVKSRNKWIDKNTTKITALNSEIEQDKQEIERAERIKAKLDSLLE